MKIILTILSIVFSLSLTAQNTHTQSNANTNEQFQGSVETKVGFINAHFSDTTAANLSWISRKPFSQIVTGNGMMWLRNSTATRWIGTGTSSISISSDSSSLVICNSIGACDTIPIAVAPINNFTVINDTTIIVCGASACDTIHTVPINYNQNVVNRVSVVNGSIVDSVFYFINGVKYLAGTINTGGNNSTVSISADSSALYICNASSCDTFLFSSIAPIQKFTIVNDTTIVVCGTSSCDTFHTAPTVYNKFYVDSVIVSNGDHLDTLKYYVNGNAIIGGYIGGRYYNKDEIDSIFTINGVSNESNRIISGGVVTYSGSGLTYFGSSCIYMIGKVVYYSPQATITLTAADATNPRIDLFAVDTLSEAIKITGVAAAVPLTPQVDPNSQLALTTGITLPPNATTPTGTSSTLIYDENVEWSTGGTATVNYNNTTQPYHGTKDAFVSAYSKNSTLTFTGTTQTVNGQTLRAFIRLNNANYSFQFRFYNGSTAVSNSLTLNGFGFNPALYNAYQNVSIPLTSFTWSGTAFDKLVITMTGKGATGTFYIDYISLEGGTPIITPPTDYSNKVDSVTIKKITFGSDTANISINWIKGIGYPKKDTVWTGGAIDSLDVSLLKGDTINRIHLPTFTSVISHEGTGLWTIYGSASDTLHAKNIKGAGGITVTTDTDSSLVITGSGSGGTGGISKVGSPTYGLTRVNDSTYVLDSATLSAYYLRRKDSTISFITPYQSSLKQSQLNGTGFVKMTGTTPSYVTSPIDSSAYHTASVYQDTTLILNRPNGINDSISFHIGIPTTKVDSVTTKKINDSTYAVLYWVGSTSYQKGDTIKTHSSGGSVTGGSITWPGTVFSTPTTGSVSSGNLSFTPSLASQSAYTLFGRSSGSGTPSFLTSIDSNWVTGLHSQNYYNTKYAAIGAVAGWGLSGNTLGTSGGNFIGSLDTAAFRVRVENKEYLVIDSSGLTSIKGTVTIPLNTTAPQIQAGNLQIQSYAVNNSWIGDNLYYSAGFKRRAAGYGNLFYFSGSEGQWRFVGNGAVGGAVDNSGLGNVQFKSNYDGTTAIGRNLSTTPGGYTGASFIVFGATGNVGVNFPADVSDAAFNVNGNSKLSGIELQTFNANQSYIGYNIFYYTAGTPGFKYRAGGYGLQTYVYNGNYRVSTAPSSSTGSYATLTKKFGISNNGDVGIGNITNDSTLTGANIILTNGGQIGVGTLTPNASAVADFTSTTQGVLLPRMTTIQRNAISSPATGLTIYCTDCTATDSSTGVTQTYNGSGWKNYW